MPVIKKSRNVGKKKRQAKSISSPDFKVFIPKPKNGSKKATDFYTNLSEIAYNRLGFKSQGSKGAVNGGGRDDEPLTDSEGNIVINQGCYTNKYKIVIGLPQAAAGKKQAADRTATMPVSKSWKVTDVLKWAETHKLGSGQTRIKAIITPSGKRYPVGGLSRANKAKAQQN